MSNTLITSKTRIKLILKFFLNTKEESYFCGLEEKFGDPRNGCQLEINKFKKVDLLDFARQRNKKLFCTNTKHPLFPNIHNLLIKYLDFNEIIKKMVNKLGERKKVYLERKLAQGIDSDILDLIINK